jgi:hypothetical protein
MLVFARLCNTCGYHALLYDIPVFLVLPIKDLRNSKAEMSTPYELCYGKTPNLGSYGIFDFPVVAKNYTITHRDGRVTKSPCPIYRLSSKPTRLADLPS